MRCVADKIMEAVILCAGTGSRLKNVSNETPKCMIEISGSPLIVYTLNKLAKSHINDIYINLHYKPEIIKKYLGDGLKYNLKITYSYEENLLGTAGALNNFKNHIIGDFMVIYGDTYRELDFSEMINAFYKLNCIGLIALHKPENIFDSGVVALDSEFKILEFIEKPKFNANNKNKFDYSNAGVYIFKNEIFNYIPARGFSDFGKDIFPILLNNQDLFGFPINGTVIDIGTPERLQKLNDYMLRAPTNS